MFLYFILTLFAIIGSYFTFVYLSLKRRCESNGALYLGNGTIRTFLNGIRGISVAEDTIYQYNQLKKSGLKVGMSNSFGFQGVIIGDPELLKCILIKDFEHFIDHRSFFGHSDHDFIIKKMLITQNGDYWKELRTKLSPIFTTGKIKRVFLRFDQSAKKFINFIQNNEMKNENLKMDNIDFTFLYCKYSIDVIASAVCSLDSHAFDQKGTSTFERMGKSLSPNQGFLRMLKIVTIKTLPKFLVNYLHLSSFSIEGQRFLADAIQYLIEKRRQNPTEKYDDFLQLMLETREGKLKTEENELETFEKNAELKNLQTKYKVSDMLDDDGIVANCILFIIGGFATSQSLFGFCTYELARNQDIQNLLREEINTVLKETNGELTYDTLTKMTYLDMIVNETLRIWPAIVVSDRLCVKDYKVPGTNFVIKKGEVVDIPTCAIQMDPDIYPNPDVFDPQRFSPENKRNISQYTYLPFSQGPRNCIAMRFALTEAKVVIVHLIKNFQIKLSSKTLQPMKFNNEGKTRGSLYLNLTKIQK